MRLIKFFLVYSRVVVLWSLIAGLVGGVSNAALLGVINHALKSNGSATMTLVASFIALCLILPSSRYVSEILLSSLGQSALHKLRMKLVRQILAAPARHLEQLGSSRLMAALTDDVPSITGAITAIPVLCINGATVLGCLVYLGFLSWGLVAFLLVFLVVGILGYQLPIIKAQKVFRRARREGDALVEHFRALTYGMKELKIHNQRREAFVNDLLEATSASFRRHHMAGIKIYTAAASWGQTLVFVVIGLFIFILPSMHDPSGGTLTGYTISLLYLMAPLQVIMNSLPGLGRANVALDNVEDLGFALTTSEKEDVSSASATRKEWDRLSFRSITHSYSREGEANKFVLGPINLSFDSGDVVFITGGNGSGKTTFAKLLTGLYIPETGHIVLDDWAIADAQSREEYRQYFSVVFSDFYLFEQLLGLLSPGIDDAAREYLQRLKLSHKVEIKDGKLSTTDLSQGQRKRLALLTAYLEDRSIYMFDEWAADQDPYFKEIFYLQLVPELKARKKTVFIITHDDRYFHVADRVIRLEEGNVVGDTRKVEDQVAFELVQG